MALALALAAYFYHRRTRADVSPSVDDVLGALRKTVSDSSIKNLKDSTDLDNQIKKFISHSDACVQVCDEILKIVSEHIATLGPWPQVRCKNSITFLPHHNLQHLWCQLLSGSLTSGGLDRLNAFLDDKRHTGRARCVFPTRAPSDVLSWRRCIAFRFLAYGCCDLQVTLIDLLSRTFVPQTLPQGRVAIHIAFPSCRSCLEARFLFMNRFDIHLDKSQYIDRPPSHHYALIFTLLAPFRYISATSRVVIASEKTTAAAGGETILRKVALKFMKNGDQFAREKESREFFKDMDDYVVGIYNAFTKENKVYKDALDNSCVPFHSTPLLNCQTSRNLLLLSSVFTTHLVSSYFHDFKDYPFLLVMPSADCDLKTIIRCKGIAFGGLVCFEFYLIPNDGSY